MRKLTLGIASFSLMVFASLSARATEYVITDSSYAITEEKIAKDSDIYVVNGGEVELQIPDGKQIFYPHLVVSNAATVRITGTSRSQIQFAMGLRVLDKSSVVCEVAPAVHVGRAVVASGNKNWPVCEVRNSLTFGDQLNPTGLVLRDKVTVRKLPETCPVSVLSTGGRVSIALQEGTAATMLGPLGYTGGDFTVQDYDVLICRAATFPDGTKITVKPGATLTFRPSNPDPDDRRNWKFVSYQTGRYNIKLDGPGSKVVFSASDDYWCRCESNITGKGEVWGISESGLGTMIYGGHTYYTSTSSGKSVMIPIDDEVAAAKPVPTGWQSKVAHWFDMSDDDSMIPFSYKSSKSGWENVKNEFNGNPIIIGVKDKNSGSSDVFLYNNRIWSAAETESDYVLQVMPYRVEGGLNGKSYLSFGPCYTNNAPVTANAKYNASGSLVSVNEARRLLMWKGGDSGSSKPKSGGQQSFVSPYCIMVYNSANGGGKAILNTKDGTGYGNPARGSSELTYVWTTYDGFGLYTDGFKVVPKSTKPNGGWQILSFDMSATNTCVQGISGHRNGTYGGMDYAEVIFFSEKPTAEERADCERYLANKWGLKDSYYNLTHRAEEFQGDGTVNFKDLSQSSDPQLTDAVIEGCYKGRIVVGAGQTLHLGGRPLPPSEADLPQTGLVGWFDPSYPDAIDLNQADTGNKHIERLYGRTLTGLAQADGDYWLSAQHQANKTGRCALKASRPSGVPEYAADLVWMDFAGKTGGNTLRFHRLPSTDTAPTSADALNIREGFIVMDTSLGGGNPIGTAVGFNSVIFARDGSDVNAPIWNSNNTITMNGTWLDTTEVNGSEHGFSGRGEVFSFETAANLPAGFFGYYNNNGANYEKMGEILLYSTPLSAADRTKVQEYLMWKWLGSLNGKYSDFTAASVTGAGTVKSATLRGLPHFGMAGYPFTGTLAGGSAMDFTIDSAVSRTNAVDAITIDRAVALDDAAVVTIHAAGKLRAGTYTLLTATAITGGAHAQLVMPEGAPKARLVVSGTEIQIEVLTPGLTILVL